MPVQMLTQNDGVIHIMTVKLESKDDDLKDELNIAEKLRLAQSNMEAIRTTCCSLKPNAFPDRLRYTP